MHVSDFVALIFLTKKLINLVPEPLFRLTYKERKIKNVMQQLEKLNRKITWCAMHIECSYFHCEERNQSYKQQRIVQFRCQLPAAAEISDLLSGINHIFLPTY